MDAQHSAPVQAVDPEDACGAGHLPRCTLYSAVGVAPPIDA